MSGLRAPKAAIVAKASPRPTDTGSVWRGSNAGERVTFTLNRIEYAFRWCPPGEFTMGSPKWETDRGDDEDQVQVELTRGFWMQETAVTQGMWRAVMGTQPWQGKDYCKEGSKFAATNLKWNEATEFAEKLQAAARQANALPSDGKIILPTEARWEYACRAGTTTAWSFGNYASKVGEYAWFVDNTLHKDEFYMHEVGLKKPNPWGLCDLQGNTWEWCQDLYQEKLPGGRDPIVNGESARRVLRGGAFNDAPCLLRCSKRSKGTPTIRSFSTGFRVVVES